MANHHVDRPRIIGMPSPSSVEAVVGSVATTAARASIVAVVGVDAYPLAGAARVRRSRPRRARPGARGSGPAGSAGPACRGPAATASPSAAPSCRAWRTGRRCAGPRRRRPAGRTAAAPPPGCGRRCRAGPGTRARVMSAPASMRSSGLAQRLAPPQQPGDVLGLPEPRPDRGDQGRLRPVQDAVALGVGEDHARARSAFGLSAATSTAAQHVGVAGVEPLEAAVAAEPVDQVGSDPAADPCRTLEDAHLQAGLLQRPCASESGDPRADHGHVRGVHGW